MVTFFLIGGKDNLIVLNQQIESKLLELTGKTCPRVLFCGYAALNALEKANSRFQSLMNGLNCEIRLMKLEDKDNLDALLNWCDIFYIGGGCCNNLVEFFYANHYDNIITKYLSTNKLFGGVSAGAMLFTKIAMGDRDVFTDNYHSYNYKMVKCLGFLPISICPHYNNEDLIIYNDEIRYYKLDSFGIENNTALIIKGNDFFVLKDDKTFSVYFFCKNTYQMVPLYEGIKYKIA